MTISSNGTAVSLSLTGAAPAGPVLVELPAFVNNIATVSTGTMDEQTGTVTVSSGTRRVTVALAHTPANP